MRSKERLAATLLLVTVLGVTACNTYADALSRGQRAFEQSEHERALAIFRSLEPDVYRLSVDDRAHYAYLRGMTDYRIGYKAEARHWLSIAAAIEHQTPGALPADWSKRLTESVKDLNDSVYTGGIASLSNTPSPPKRAGEDEGEEANPAPPPATAKPDGE
jgi:hypothetical protein